MHPNRYGHPARLAWLAAALLAWAGAAAADNRASRDAFNMGYEYGSATKIVAAYGIKNPQAQRIFESSMTDADVIGRRLDVKVNTNAPTSPPGDPDRFHTISSIAIERAQLLRTAVEARHGGREGLLVWLGYNGAWAPEVFSRTDSNTRHKMAGQLADYCGVVGLPASACASYSATLSTGDFKRSTNAMFRFASTINRHFEGKYFATVDGQRTMLNAWRLGEKLSLATLGQTRAKTESSKASVNRLFDQAQVIADALDIPVGAMPHSAVSASATHTAAALHYILDESGKTIGHALTRDYGKAAEACFEFAIKAPLLALFYSETEDKGTGISGAIEGALLRSGQATGLPRDLWTPLTSKVTARRPYAEVKPEILGTLRRVENYLLAKTSPR